MSFLPVDVTIDQKAKERHRIDTLNLLCYVVLLVLVLVTTWFLKRRKRLHLHETGLAIIYGLIMGAILRYFGLEITISAEQLRDNIPLSVPADYVIVAAHQIADKNPNDTHFYAYEFRGEIKQSAKLGSQISYASVNPEVFFNIILPPIVLNAGLSLKRRHFFRNIGAIFCYAFIGTTISVATVGSLIYGSIQLLKHFLGSTFLADRFSLANCLYFGAIISPTDPLAVLAIFQELGVDVNLFALVFGESILNDAVSIVLTHSIGHFSVIYERDLYYSILSIIWQCVHAFINMFFTSCLIGIVFGIITALTTKFTKLTESPLLESSLVVLMSYSSFLTAEVIDASGIVAILLCGITQAHYTINNLSFEARERLKNLFELLTFLCENFLFLAVGVSFWQRGQTWDMSFIGIAFASITIARALSVYPLTLLLNLGRRNKIPMNFQHLLTWGGCARGVISYSLAARNTVGDARQIMLSTTSVIVIVTVTAVGGLAVRMLKWWNIPFGPELGDKQLTDHDEHASMSAINNPSWLVRPKRLTSTNGSEFSPSVSSKLAHHAYYPRGQRAFASRLLSPGATPVLEIGPTATSSTAPRATSWGQHQASPFDHLEYTDQDETVTHLHEPLATLREQEQQTGSEGLGGEAQLASCPPSVASSVVGLNESQLSSNGERAAAKRQEETAIHPYENANLVRRWRAIDNNFIKPLLTNSQPTLIDTMPAALRSLARLFTSDEQLMRQR